MKTICKLVCIPFFLLVSMVSIQASSNVTYVGDSSGFVFKPGSDHSITDLFPSFKNCMPGDTLQEQIEIRNGSDKAVNIYMKVLGATSGKIS